MKRYLLASAAIALFVFSLISCQKDKGLSVCPVDYTIDTQGTYTINNRWEFVGFEDMNTGELESPLCGQVESWIQFADTANTQSGNDAYKNGFRFEGVALINHYGGTYDVTQDKQLILSPTLKTTIRGTGQVEDFEAKFHQILGNIDHYRIENNELFLEPTYGSTRMRFVATNTVVPR